MYPCIRNCGWNTVKTSQLTSSSQSSGSNLGYSWSARTAGETDSPHVCIIILIGILSWERFSLLRSSNVERMKTQYNNHLPTTTTNFMTGGPKEPVLLAFVKAFTSLTCPFLSFGNITLVKPSSTILAISSLLRSLNQFCCVLHKTIPRNHEQSWTCIFLWVITTVASM